MPSAVRPRLVADWLRPMDLWPWPLALLEQVVQQARLPRQPRLLELEPVALER